MFGFVMANKPELKVKEYEKYHAYYCGLCYRLKKLHGRRGQITLTYDLTFLIILLTSLYEKELTVERHSCMIHPMKKHTMAYNEISDYAADMNVALSYYKLQDDWNDDKKVHSFLGAFAFRRRYRNIERRYPKQCHCIEECLTSLSQYEQEGSSNIDEVSGCFGRLMSELMVYRQDPFEQTLRAFGFYLGKFIYLMDAAMDISEDMKNNSYNVFRNFVEREDFDEYIRELLLMMIGEAAKEFEKLPCEWDIDLLRNIIYQGVWIKYERNQKKHDE